ncbi:MAG TPA: cytochrome c [Gemmatimonadaceae bacterium]|nr:cytochrome c [Gemmatimonadaceae bacterium]
MPQQSKGIAIAVVSVVGAIGLLVVVGRALIYAGGAHTLPYPAVTDKHPDPTIFATVVGKPTAGLDLGAMLTASPQALAHGKQLFDVSCVMCHGAMGKGDGAAAVALTPRPRDFSKAQGWTVGYTMAAIYTTLSDGVKGTGMPAFDALTPPDRFAVAHYVQSLGAFDHHDNQAEDIKQIDARYHLGEGPLAPSKVAVPTVMTHMEAEYTAPPAVTMPPASDRSMPAELRRGLIADSVRAAEVLSEAPDWRANMAVFTRVAMSGAPSNGFRPAVAALNAAQWKAFHDELVRLTPVPGTGGADTATH